MHYHGNDGPWNLSWRRGELCTWQVRESEKRMPGLSQRRSPKGAAKLGWWQEVVVRNRTCGEVTVMHNNKVRIWLKMKSCRGLEDRTRRAEEGKETQSQRIKRFSRALMLHYQESHQEER